MQLCKCQIIKIFLYELFFFNLLNELFHYYNFFFGLIFEKYYSFKNINLNHYCRYHVVYFIFKFENFYWIDIEILILHLHWLNLKLNMLCEI